MAALRQPASSAGGSERAAVQNLSRFRPPMFVMHTLRQRLTRLEHSKAPLDRGRCPGCRDWPAIVVIRRGVQPHPDPCPMCGWVPQIIEEVVVNTRAEALAWIEAQRR